MNVILVAGALIYLAIVVAVWALQDRLLFYPQPAAQAVAAPAGWRLEEVSLAVRGGHTVRGVLVLPPRARTGAVMYFGGNAEEVTANARGAHAAYGERAVLFVNYRGYGLSDGIPGEKEIVEDSVALYDWLAQRPDVDPARIVVHGRSLGSGVAVQVASQRPVAGVVLSTPFDSAVEVARQVYPWIPVGWLMRHPFDSTARAGSLRAPALVLIAADDTLVRPERAQRLAAAWGGPVEKHVFAGYSHGDVHLAPEYDRTVRAFLDRCFGGA